MRLAGKKVLVTGADGFIGSHLVEALVAAGCDVRAFVCYNSLGSWGWLDDSPERIRRDIEVVAGDVRDGHCVLSALRDREVVFHLAALIAIPFSYLAPEAYIDTNVKGTLNLLHAARTHGIERFVHTSTSEVYGTARFVPITEEHPLQAQSPYAASKIGADQLAWSFWRSHDVPVATIRPFNTYGPRQSARAVIPTIITQLAAGRRRIELGALTPTRDFNYVADTVNGFMKVAEADAAVGEVVNVGSGHEIAVGDLAALIAEVMGLEAEIIRDPKRLRPEASEVERLLADNAKAARLADWTPRHGGRDGLRRGLTETAAWFSDPDNLRRYKIDRYNI